MIASIRVLLALAALAMAALLYRKLVRSQWLTRLIGGFEPTPEADSDVVQRLDDAEAAANRRAVEAEMEATAKRETAEAIRKRTSRKA